jgi:hypothetical protein
MYSSLFANVLSSKKRSFGERMTSMPPVSPERKKTRVSAIRTALGKSPKGLLRFLQKCTPAEYKEQVQRATGEENNWDEGKQEKVVAAKIHRAKRTQEVDRLRQQRHRQNKYDKEISLGE